MRSGGTTIVHPTGDSQGDRTTAVQLATAPLARRGFFARLCGLAMTISLLASYGTFAAMAGRFLLPTRPRRRGWLLVSDAPGFARGSTRTFVAPTGEKIVIARRVPTSNASFSEFETLAAIDEFIALSSTCPHLGCQVRYEPAHARFFCPCHNGTFSPDGEPTGGPPLDAGQSLPRYPLELRGTLLYIEVPLEGVSS